MAKIWVYGETAPDSTGFKTTLEILTRARALGGDVSAVALVDGHRVGELGPGSRALARLGEQRSLLATLAEETFFSRYRRTFAS